MKQRKLRSYVLPTVYVLLLMLVFGAVSLVSTLMKTSPNYLYSIGLFDWDARPVVDIPGNLSDGVIKPFTASNVVVDKYFYDVNDSEEKQRNSLIYFQNTYMKNTGVLYNSNETFDCVMVLDGTILNVREDDILGKTIEVEHNTNLRTIYYSVDQIQVKAGDVLSQGEVIATSGANNITDNKNSLLFEVYYNGTLINPEAFYSMDASTLN